MSEVKQRPASATTSSPAASDTGKKPPPEKMKSRPAARTEGLSQALTSAANLANLLPTGTLLAFQILTPVFTNNGACDPTTRVLTIGLLFVLGLSCMAACFTDSVKADDGKVYHGVATPWGLWMVDYPDPSGSGLPDLSKKKMRLMDWVHGILSVMVFGAVALRDKNVTSCLYPTPGLETKQVLDIVPLGIGVLCGMLFVVFPTTRHGIGYSITPGN